jgi:hypothetical protein
MSGAKKILGIAAGVGAAMIIGIIAYGEITKPVGTPILERPTEQWTVGNFLTENTMLSYSITHTDNNYQEINFILRFDKGLDENWDASLTIIDPVKGTVEQDLLMSRSLLPISTIKPEVQPYMRMAQGSVLWIVDFAIEPKYLAAGAVWGSITHGVQKEDLTIIGKEDVETQAGTYNSYVLGYEIRDKESKIWIVKEKPLPVKGEIYDADGNLQSRFELIKD